MSHLSGVMGFAREQAGRPPRNLRARLKRGSRTRNESAAARQRLVEAGCGPDLVKTLPPTQVILLDEKRDYEIQRDERMKLLALPLWQIDLARRRQDMRSRTGTGCSPISCPTLSSSAGPRENWSSRSPCLRHVEALRMYAAEHDGKLPSKLSDIPVPLPIDPVTGKPFVYAIAGATAHIRGRSSQAEENDPESNVHYEVTLQK